MEKIKRKQKQKQARPSMLNKTALAALKYAENHGNWFRCFEDVSRRHLSLQTLCLRFLDHLVRASLTSSS